MNQIKIPRHVLSKNPSDIQSHGFSDASELSYGAEVYQHGNILNNLLCAKLNVALLKVISLQRLELCGALILSCLIMKVIESLNLNLNHIFLWTDSQIVLAQLSPEPTNLKAFITEYPKFKNTENCK